MPEMNGQDLSEEITALFPDIICMFMSGYTSGHIIHGGALDEGIHFIQKPFTTQALAKMVREVLDSK
jgi:FixJ family two-component response regulator